MFRSAALALASRLLAYTVLITGFAFATGAQPGPPRVSPQAKLSQTIGSSTIEIVYGRPSVRGRTIWGDLEAWDKVWRTGANEATTFSISHDATIGGQPLPAGTYALFTIPRADRWSVIFNKTAEQWGAFSHDPAQDVLVVEVKPRTVPLHETLQFSVPVVATDRATVELVWERTAISFEVAFDADATALSKAKAEVAEAGDASRVAYNWARHFQTQGTHLEVALGWASASAKAADHYWTQSVRARILADLGRVEQAKKAAHHALTVIEAAPNPEFAKRDGEKLKEEMAGW